MNKCPAVVLAVVVVMVGLLWGSVALGTAAIQAGAYVVDDEDDDPDAKPGDGLCVTVIGTCTLRAAITEANLDGVVSTITFARPMAISYPALPPLTEQWTTIDGSSRWDGVWPNGRPGVSIGGAGYTNGLLRIRAKSITVRGIEFSGSGSVGIDINGADAGTLGGTEPGQRNVFLGGTGIYIAGGMNHQVTGNYFGTWDGQNPVLSVLGMDIRSDNNVIEGNVFGGHSTAGIRIWGGKNNQVRDNAVGANHLRNKPLPNALGITLESAAGNIIGPYNFVAGNSGHGVELRHADENVIFNNRIGDPLNFGNGGDGIHVHVSHRNQLGRPPGNVVAQNGGCGIRLNGSDGNSISSSYVGENGLDGIYISSGKENVIGSPAAGEGNAISANGANGIQLSSTGTISSVVLGNEIGFHQGAFASGNLEHGILIANGSSGNVIGGLGQGEGNRVGFNKGNGIYLRGSDTQNNGVAGNVIGAPVNWGWEAPNGQHGIAVYDGAHHNSIGWGNKVIASGWSGVAVVNSHDNLVWFNFIGSDGADVTWGNNAYGVHLVDSANNQVLLNEIAYSGVSSGRAGVRVEGGAAKQNVINTNSIHDNGGAGIELVSGGNMGRAAPVIAQASCQGPLSGTSCADCLVEIFSDAAGEGKVFEAGVKADGGGAFAWSGTPNGPHVTATATDSAGNTSPFSAPVNVGLCNAAPAAVFSVTPAEGPAGTTFQFDGSASHDKEDNAAALEVRWDWEDDGAFDTPWQGTKTAAYKFPAAGLYTTRLQVRDSGGLIDAATQQVHVTGQLFDQTCYLPLIRRK